MCKRIFKKPSCIEPLKIDKREVAKDNQEENSGGRDLKCASDYKGWAQTEQNGEVLLLSHKMAASDCLSVIDQIQGD
jgi:hypothetical protein